MRSRLSDESKGSWTAATRRQFERRLPWENLLPDRQPSYVGSWVYIFGVVTIAALIWVVLSGVVLALFGPQWWHLSSAGRFVNSLHFWSVQLFFVFMVLHLCVRRPARTQGSTSFSVDAVARRADVARMTA